MAYVKNVPAWAEGVAPGISAARLNHLETQYEEFAKLYDVNSILMATADNTPFALTIGPSRIFGRPADPSVPAALSGAQVLTIIGRVGKANLQWANTKLLLGAGAGADPTEIDVPAGPTKEIFALAVGFSFAGATPEQTEYGVLINGAGHAAGIWLLFPHDFTTITSIEVILRPRETGGGMHLDFITSYGAYGGGENWNVHGETADAQDIGATTANQYLAHSIATLVDDTPPAAGDLLHVEVLYDATAVDSNAYVMGLRLRYT